jgi:hypothetical protein
MYKKRFTSCILRGNILNNCYSCKYYKTVLQWGAESNSIAFYENSINCIFCVIFLHIIHWFLLMKKEWNSHWSPPPPKWIWALNQGKSWMQGIQRKYYGLRLRNIKWAANVFSLLNHVAGKTWLHSVEWWWMMTWKGCGRQQSWFNLRSWPSICLERLRKTTTEKCGQDRQCFYQDTNWLSPKSTPKQLTLEQSSW